MEVSEQQQHLKEPQANLSSTSHSLYVATISYILHMTELQGGQARQKTFVMEKKNHPSLPISLQTMTQNVL